MLEMITTSENDKTKYPYIDPTQTKQNKIPSVLTCGTCGAPESSPPSLCSDWVQTSAD